MKKFGNISDVSTAVPFPNAVKMRPGQYHPFSYYVLGGTDLEGRALADVGDVHSDDDADLDFGVPVDCSADPRTSKFDIAEQVGIDAFKEMQERAATSEQTEKENE